MIIVGASIPCIVIWMIVVLIWWLVPSSVRRASVLHVCLVGSLPSILIGMSTGTLIPSILVWRHSGALVPSIVVWWDGSLRTLWIGPPIIVRHAALDWESILPM